MKRLINHLLHLRAVFNNILFLLNSTHGVNGSRASAEVSDPNRTGGNKVRVSVVRDGTRDV